MRRIGAFGAAAFVLIVGAAGCATPARWVNEPLVGPTDGSRPVLSPDGTKLAFVTDAALVSVDTNGVRDVYLRELASGATTLVSVNAAGTNGGDEQSFDPVFSADGTKMTFGSTASDLTSPGTDPFSANVFLRDLAAGSTTVVSVGNAGHDVSGFSPGIISPDGTKVLFSSWAGDFGPTDTNHTYDVYMRDTAAGTTTLISANGAGTDSGNNASMPVGFAGGGTKVVFESDANDLGPPDNNGGAGPDNDSDVFVCDLATNTTSLVSINRFGSDSANGSSTSAAISPDGMKVAFASSATDLVAGITTAAGNIYVRNLTAGTTSLATPAGSGGGGGDNWSDDPQFSPDGTKLVFLSRAGNLGPPDVNDRRDVYVRDLAAGSTQLVSVNADGTSGGNQSELGDDNATFVPSFSPDGTKVAFVTTANNLGPTDTGMCDIDPKPYPPVPCPDVYVRDLAPGTTALVSGNGNDTEPNTYSAWPVFSPVDNHMLVYVRNYAIQKATQVQ